MMPAADTMRLAPTITATGVMVETCTVGRPARSSSLAIAAPQRVLVPQVEVRITASTPASLSLAGDLLAHPRAVGQRRGHPNRGVDGLVELADGPTCLQFARHVDGHQTVRVL